MSVNSVDLSKYIAREDLNLIKNALGREDFSQVTGAFQKKERCLAFMNERLNWCARLPANYQPQELHAVARTIIVSSNITNPETIPGNFSSQATRITTPQSPCIESVVKVAHTNGFAYFVFFLAIFALIISIIFIPLAGFLVGDDGRQTAEVVAKKGLAVLDKQIEEKAQLARFLAQDQGTFLAWLGTERAGGNGAQIARACWQNRPQEMHAPSAPPRS